MKQVIVIRKDLKMRKGKIGVQCSHASSMITYIFHNHSNIINWINDGIYKKIVLGCENLEHLCNIINECEDKEVIYHVVEDLGLTVFGEPTITCVGIGPEDENVINEICGKLKPL